MPLIKTNPLSEYVSIETVGHRAPQCSELLRAKIPQLLVSVRSVDEAIGALAGGAEILDVKEPSLGSLGMASLDEIAAISKLGDLHSRGIPLSVALGELLEWVSNGFVPSLPEGISFAKMGLHGCANVPDWQSRWQCVRRDFERVSQSQIRWVAVAYADAAEAESPSIDEILHAARSSNCAGLLIDTWAKGGRTLFDSAGVADLIEIAQVCHAAGLFLAVAGRLNRQMLSDLSAVPADVLAIRSAACREADRTVELVPSRIREFRQQMHDLRS